MADTLVLEASAVRCAGSSPVSGTRYRTLLVWVSGLNLMVVRLGRDTYTEVRANREFDSLNFERVCIFTTRESGDRRGSLLESEIGKCKSCRVDHKIKSVSSPTAEAIGSKSIQWEFESLVTDQKNKTSPRSPTW